MANVDRPNGFKFVKTMGGVATAQVRAVGVADAADISIGDAISLSSGLATPMAVGGECLGVAVGFGKRDPLTGSIGSMVNPDNLLLTMYDDSASTHTDFVVFYIPAAGNIFEAQVDDTAATLVVGEAQDIIATSGAMEINGDALTNDGDVMVVEVPDLPDNDPTLAYGRYWVVFVDTQFAAPIA